MREGMELTALIQGAGAILGSSIVAAIVGHYTVIVRETREDNLKRLEALWKNVDSHSLNITKVFHTHYAELRKGGKSSEILENSFGENSHIYSEITLCLNIYFQELLPYWKEVETAKFLMAATTGSMMTGATRPAVYEIQVDMVSDKFVKAAYNFKLRIADTALRVKNENLLSPISRGIGRAWRGCRRWLDSWEQY